MNIENSGVHFTNAKYVYFMLTPALLQLAEQVMPGKKVKATQLVTPNPSWFRIYQQLKRVVHQCHIQSHTDKESKVISTYYKH